MDSQNFNHAQKLRELREELAKCITDEEFKEEISKIGGVPAAGNRMKVDLDNVSPKLAAKILKECPQFSLRQY